jgi:thioester reductase-like protein
LASEIDVILHNGASLNILESYSALRPGNVIGTREVLRLACLRKIKPVHFISSLAVFDRAQQPAHRVVQERDIPDDPGSLRYGYTQSKAVSERLVRTASARRIPTVIYRPGLINACTATGAYTTRDFVARLLKSWIGLGLAPVLDRELLFTPVDYVSRAIVHLLGRTDSIGKTFHLVNTDPLAVSDLVDMIRAAGYPLRQVPFGQWRSHLMNCAGQIRDEGLSEVLPFLPADDGDDALPFWPPHGMRFDCRETRAALNGSDLCCPAMGAEQVEKCLSYFARIGFLRQPLRAVTAP